MKILCRSQPLRKTEDLSQMKFNTLKVTGPPSSSMRRHLKVTFGALRSTCGSSAPPESCVFVTQRFGSLCPEKIIVLGLPWHSTQTFLHTEFDSSTFFVLGDSKFFLFYNSCQNDYTFTFFLIMNFCFSFSLHKQTKVGLGSQTFNWDDDNWTLILQYAWL